MGSFQACDSNCGAEASYLFTEAIDAVREIGELSATVCGDAASQLPLVSSSPDLKFVFGFCDRSMRATRDDDGSVHRARS